MSRSKKKNRWKTIRLVLLYIISSSQATKLKYLSRCRAYPQSSRLIRRPFSPSIDHYTRLSSRSPRPTAPPKAEFFPLRESFFHFAWISNGQLVSQSFLPQRFRELLVSVQECELSPSLSSSSFPQAVTCGDHASALPLPCKRFQ